MNERALISVASWLLLVAVLGVGGTLAFTLGDSDDVERPHGKRSRSLAGSQGSEGERGERKSRGGTTDNGRDSDAARAETPLAGDQSASAVNDAVATEESPAAAAVEANAGAAMNAAADENSANDTNAPRERIESSRTSGAISRREVPAPDRLEVVDVATSVGAYESTDEQARAPLAERVRGRRHSNAPDTSPNEEGATVVPAGTGGVSMWFTTDRVFAGEFADDATSRAPRTPYDTFVTAFFDMRVLPDDITALDFFWTSPGADAPLRHALVPVNRRRAWQSDSMEVVAGTWPEGTYTVAAFARREADSDEPAARIAAGVFQITASAVVAFGALHVARDGQRQGLALDLDGETRQSVALRFGAFNPTGSDIRARVTLTHMRTGATLVDESVSITGGGEAWQLANVAVTRSWTPGTYRMTVAAFGATARRLDFIVRPPADETTPKDGPASDDG